MTPREKSQHYPELFRRHERNPILTANDWPYPVHTVFNGGADSCLALATARLADVLDYVRTCPAPPPRERPGMAH
jgi:predicted GH43/DUF377 family glycosyl hydrolase